MSKHLFIIITIFFSTPNFLQRRQFDEVAYLFWLVGSLLRVSLHLVVGMVCDFGHWLFED